MMYYCSRDGMLLQRRFVPQTKFRWQLVEGDVGWFKDLRQLSEAKAHSEGQGRIKIGTGFFLKKIMTSVAGDSWS